MNNRSLTKSVLAAGVLAGLALPAGPAAADPPPWAPAHGYRAKHHRGHYAPPRVRYYRTDNGIRYWRGDNGRYYCRRSNGTTGLLVGGVAGALVGRSIDRHGDRTAGTVLGAAAGALIGHSIDRSSRCR